MPAVAPHGRKASFRKSPHSLPAPPFHAARTPVGAQIPVFRISYHPAADCHDCVVMVHAQKNSQSSHTFHHWQWPGWKFSRPLAIAKCEVSWNIMGHSHAPAAGVVETLASISFAKCLQTCSAHKSSATFA